MIKNYFKITFRNIIRHKAFAAINISGLAIGIAACLLLFTVIKYELSYDKFQTNYQRIYHVVTKDKYSDEIKYTPGVPIPVLAALRLDIPQVTSGGLYASYGSQVTVLESNTNANSAEKKFIEESGNFFSDPEFFKIFHFNWLVGSPSVLSEPNVTVLSRKRAEKYFGDWKSATGQFLKLDNAVTVKVAAILEDVPGNSDFPLSQVTSFETFKQNPGLYGSVIEWGHTSSDFQVFMLLPENITADNINTQLAQFSKKHYTSRKKISERLNYLQPLSEVHFDSRLGNFGDHMTSKSTLWTLSLIGIFIILMACINFINLSTAQAVGRSKEVGIRKVLGSNRKQLFSQIMGETAVVVTGSVILAIGIAVFCLPFIKHISSIQESLSLMQVQTILFLLVVIISVTIFSGLYPSLILSGFNPTLALKNKITSASVGGISLRRGLIVLQFSISQILIVGTIVAVSQMNFVQHADLGFNKEGVFILNANTDSVLVSRQPAFKQKLLQLSNIQSVTFSSDAPSSDNNMSTNFSFDHKPDEPFHIYLKYADEDYLKTFGLQIIAGKNFSGTDTAHEVVINEMLVKKLGIKNPEAIIGKEINTGKWRKIVGVVKDFKTNSLREVVKPTLIAEKKEFYGVTGIKLQKANRIQTIASIQKTWDEFYPEYAYTSSFMDENIAKFYEQENQLSLLYKIFAGIAIFISCLGLYGLVSFMAVQRTKEIGVRKVLGASVRNIIYMFSKEFTVLILIGFLVASPVAWYMMNSWLANFAYRININAQVFAIAIIISIIIAWITVGYKSIKAALANPVKSLRTE
jgi:putative ABC transport system permease protein